MTRIYLIFILVFLSVYTRANIISTSDINYGLKFKAHEFIKEERTSFWINKIDFDDFIEIGFDFSLNNNEFGYISRLCLNDTTYIDFLIKIDKQVPFLYVISKEFIKKRQIINCNRDNEIRLKLETKKDLLTFSYNHQIDSINYKIPQHKNNIKLFWGTCDNKIFTNSDVASFTLRNLYIKNKTDNIKYLWEFRNHNNNITYDKINGKELKVNNPIWIIDEHIKWKHIYKKTYDKKTFFIDDNKHGIYTINENSVNYIDLINLKEYKYILKENINLGSLTNPFIFNEKDSTIYFINIDKKGYSFISRFMFSAHEWEPHINIESLPCYMHHNIYINNKNDNFLHMFGYGHHTYHSEIYKIKNDINYNIKNPVEPRYLSAIGTNNDSILFIYGGIGNKSGNQELGIKIYNDLYKYNINTDEVTHVWDSYLNEIAAKHLEFIDENKAIALFYSPLQSNTYLTLKQIDIKNKTIKNLADTIPYIFEDTKSEASLFLSKQTKKLYALTSYSHNNGETEINVYSIAYPILSKSEIIVKKKTNNKIIIVVSITTFIIIIIYFIFLYKKRNKKINILSDNSTDSLDKSLEPYKIQQKATNISKKQTGIYLLGGFQIINKDGIDITGDFSPLMKQLLSLIILYTAKDTRGISNAKLKDILWFDKTEESARNNRSVNLRKIRLLLDTVGDINITSNNSYWKIIINDTTFCDYIYAINYINSNNIKEYNVEEIITLAHYGELLPNQNYDFFDSFKSEYANYIIDALNNLLEREDIPNNKKELIIDSLLIFDSIDEKSIQLKCKLLIKNGHIGTAKSIYDKFIKEYKTLLDTDYNQSFEEFIN